MDVFDGGFDYEAQRRSATDVPLWWLTPRITARGIRDSVVVLAPLIIIAMVANEYSSQKNDLEAACISILMNRPEYCNGDKPDGFVAQALFSIKSRYTEECMRFHRCARFGGGYPNIGVVISTALTRVFLIPIREVLGIFQQLAYISQVFVTIAAIVIITLLIISANYHYTVMRTARQAKATIQYRLSRRRPSELPSALTPRQKLIS